MTDEKRDLDYGSEAEDSDTEEPEVYGDPKSDTKTAGPEVDDDSDTDTKTAEPEVDKSYPVAITYRKGAEERAKITICLPIGQPCVIGRTDPLSRQDFGIELPVEFSRTLFDITLEKHTVRLSFVTQDGRSQWYVVGQQCAKQTIEIQRSEFAASKVQIKVDYTAFGDSISIGPADK